MENVFTRSFPSHKTILEVETTAELLSIIAMEAKEKLDVIK